MSCRSGWRNLPRGTCRTLLRVPHSSVCEGCGFLLRAFEFPPWKREALSGGLDITFLVERFHRNFGYRVVRFTRGGWPTLNDRSILLLIFRVAHPSDSAFGKGGALDCLRLSSLASFLFRFSIRGGNANAAVRSAAPVFYASCGISTRLSIAVLSSASFRRQGRWARRCEKMGQ